jgi:hypothetical protein
VRCGPRNGSIPARTRRRTDSKVARSNPADPTERRGQSAKAHLISRLSPSAVATASNGAPSRINAAVSFFDSLKGTFSL